jgi:glycosyltransferase involved in cell wall biosynthesis
MGWRSDRGVVRHTAYFIEACELSRRLRANPIRHIHAHFGTNSTTVALLAARLGANSYSFTVHGPEEFDRAPSLSLDIKVRHARFVVAISEYTRSQIFRWCQDRDWPKIRVIHCGVEPALLASTPAPISSSAGFVAVGRLSEQKGFPILLAAIERLARDGVDCHIMIAGDGPLRAELDSFIAAHGLTDRVTIAGWLDENSLKALIQSARALVLPSFAEGLPVVLMEALALNRPVIATQIAGIPELVRHMRSGWLVPAGSVSELTHTLRHAYDASPEMLFEMGGNGRKAIAEHFNVRTEAQKLAELFRKTSAN